MFKLMTVKFDTHCCPSLNFQRRNVPREREDNGDVLIT